MQQMYQKIRMLTRKGRHKHFTHLLVPHHQRDIKITNPQEIIEHLIRRNQKHFGQAHGTPFTKEPLKSCLTLDHAQQYQNQNNLPEAVQHILTSVTSNGM